MQNGRPIKSIRTGWKNVLKRVGISNCRFHDLRHTFATHALLQGADLISKRDILGHSDIRMMSRHAYSSEELKRRAVESFAKMISENKKENLIFLSYSYHGGNTGNGSRNLLKTKDVGVAR